MNIAVVLLYGLYSPDRLDYKEYFDYIIKEIEEKKYDKVILCGGVTFPQIENISEAQSAKNYLVSKSNFNKYILEEKSINTNQNIEFASKSLSEDDNVTVYCDLTRIAKISWISAHYILKENLDSIFKKMMEFAYEKDIYKPFKMKNLAVIGFDFKDKSKEEMIGQSFATLFDVMSLYNKEFERQDLEQRKNDFGLKS